MRPYLLFLACVLWSCLAPTQITFVITTDQPCANVKGTAITVGTLGGDIETKPFTTTSTFCDQGRLGSLIVVPGPHPNDEIAVRVVTGIGKSAQACVDDKLTGGCIVARRALRFVSHSALTVPIAMERSCLDVQCPITLTCRAGQCVDPRADCTGVSCPDGGTTTRWHAMSAPPFMFGPRYAHVAQPLGRKVFYWGGYQPGGYNDDGAIYDAQADKWEKIATPILPGRGDTANVVTNDGTIVIWGGKSNVGVLQDGALYANNAWSMMSAMNAPPGRIAEVTFWSDVTHEMIVWSGYDTSYDAPLGDGYAYNPTTNQWRKLPDAPTTFKPRSYAMAVWMPAPINKIAIYGGYCGTSGACSDFVTFDPMLNTWSTPVDVFMTEGRQGSVACAIDKMAYFWGGNDAYFLAKAYSDGVAIDPVANKATTFAGPLDSILPNPNRNFPMGWCALGKLWAFGGPVDGNAKMLATTGASYDPATKTWTAMDSIGAPAARMTASVVWTGVEAVVFGGSNVDGTYAWGDGAVYRP